MDFCCKSGRVDERMRRARSCGAGGIGKARLLKLTNGRRLLLGGAHRSNACFHGASLPFPMSLCREEPPYHEATGQFIAMSAAGKLLLQSLVMRCREF